MKKMRIVILLLIFNGISVFSCTNLDENPVGVFAPESFFQSAGDVEAAVNATYGRLANNNLYGDKFSRSIIERDDVGCGPQGDDPIDHFWEDSFNGNLESIWTIIYNSIAQANSTIAGAESVDMNEELRNRYIAECRIVRALDYFNAVRMWGNIPYIGEAVTNPEAYRRLEETPEAEIYQNIIADLEFSKQNLPMTQPARNRATKGTAYTMLADVYLTLGDYQKAYENAKWVIDNETALDYNLEPDFQHLFDATKQDGLKETIWSVDFLANTRQAGDGDLTLSSYSSPNDYKGGWNVLLPTWEFYNSWDDRDYRKEISFFTESVDNKGNPIDYTSFLIPRPYCSKYSRWPGQSAANRRMADYNLYIYRFAEVLLIAAEASNQINGPTGEAAGYVNRIRERARNAVMDGVVNDYPEDVSIAGMSKAAFQDLIIQERKLELMFEYKRWFTIKRLHIGQEVFGPNGTDPTATQDGNHSFNDNHYLFLKPQVEIDVNPNIVQNPGN